MKTKEFQAESKRLLEMMIHSIYTHKEIFLRELISNASDAIDKLYFKSLTDDKVGLAKDDFAIEIKIDKDARTLTISDNGIGMTEEELEDNLGIIAASGSLKFKAENNLDDESQIIGQFGVGFYSAFMAAKKVTVVSKAYGTDKAFKWESQGADGYTIEECEKDSVGTAITLELLDDSDDEKYSEYLEQYKIKSLVAKYSDYIRFPIKMEISKSRKKEDSEDEFEDYLEVETLNTMVPIWKRNKSELSDEDYNQFYTDKFTDYTKPLKCMHIKNEGASTYNALLYIPSKAPYDYYTKEFEKGLQLYSNGVLIMDKCADLLPDYFSFVKGLVDSEDLSLNISREMLQHDRQLKVIAKSIEKSVKSELLKMLRNDREKYEQFWQAFGVQIKVGIYNSFGRNNDMLKDLIMFVSSAENKSTTMEEYVTRMREDQKYIYYATGESSAKIDLLPQAEAVKDKGYEILYLTDNIDEFALKMLMSYNEKEFKSVSSVDSDDISDDKKKELEALENENSGMLAFLAEKLGEKVSRVRLSARLKTHPVCITSEGAVSVEMEKIFAAMPVDQGQKMKAEKTLEINPGHPIREKLAALYPDNKDLLEKYALLLYNQALLIEGLPVENPVEFSNLICDLM